MSDGPRQEGPGWDHDCVPSDSVDALLESWRARRADLDFRPVGVITRLARLRPHVDAELGRVFHAHGLGAADFAVLVTLARVDDGDGVSQRRLADELGLTSGTVSVRMDRLVEARLVERAPDPDARRNTRITLTQRGRELFERAVPAHLENERRLLAALSDEEQDLLAALLRKLLVEFEGSTPPEDAPLRLGLTVAPAHTTIAMRESLGLPPVAGLLVRAVERGRPAAAAGIRTGDVLLRAGGWELRSVASLYAAMDDAAPTRSLQLTLLRGTEQQPSTIRLENGVGREGRRAASGGRVARGEHVV